MPAAGLSRSAVTDSSLYKRPRPASLTDFDLRSAKRSVNPSTVRLRTGSAPPAILLFRTCTPGTVSSTRRSRSASATYGAARMCVAREKTHMRDLVLPQLLDSTPPNILIRVRHLFGLCSRTSWKPFADIFALKRTPSSLLWVAIPGYRPYLLPKSLDKSSKPRSVKRTLCPSLG